MDILKELHLGEHVMEAAVQAAVTGKAPIHATGIHIPGVQGEFELVGELRRISKPAGGAK